MCCINFNSMSDNISLLFMVYIKAFNQFFYSIQEMFFTTRWKSCQYASNLLTFCLSVLLILYFVSYKFL